MFLDFKTNSNFLLNLPKTKSKYKKEVNWFFIRWTKGINHPSRHEMSLGDLNQISIERDISGTSQKHLKKDVFFVTSLRRLRDISKKCLFCDVFKTSQIHLKKMSSVWRLEHISKKMSFPWRLWNVSKTSLASIFGFSKIRHTKMISCDFRRVIIW